MGTEVRKELEKTLVTELKKIPSDIFETKVGKNKISLLISKEKHGEIYVQHLSKADGYYAGAELIKCEAMDFCISQSPPYKSQLLNSSFYSKSSLAESNKDFGDEIGGIIRTPPAADVEATANKIQQRLVKFYFSDMENCVTAPPCLIDGILKSPENYAFPFLTALFCAQKNNLSLDSDIFQKVLNSKKIFGNKKFDLELAQKILANPEKISETPRRLAR
ncbi:hypothetical protein [Pseudomonas vanderleydeniana]|uniref:Uncharacterized protein n=1 Tax=Pseudomonas vanderleydeniana TaxID=2745495 RepID=A0A9E6TSD4_9PSED|nr:hypothetical protein [Pseudomonas vanderleydeniana]QXI28452.1 hypothetical protein HU752_000380 [Pseudomonas vanderleydeniana]